MSRIEEIAQEIARTTVEKDEAYGSSFENCEKHLSILFPEGIPKEKLKECLFIVRILDKLSRLANQPDAFGESPYRDIAGYSLLGAERHEKQSAGVTDVSEDVSGAIKTYSYVAESMNFCPHCGSLENAGIRFKGRSAVNIHFVCGGVIVYSSVTKTYKDKDPCQGPKALVGSNTTTIEPLKEFGATNMNCPMCNAVELIDQRSCGKSSYTRTFACGYSTITSEVSGTTNVKSYCQANQSKASTDPFADSDCPHCDSPEIDTRRPKNEANLSQAIRYTCGCECIFDVGGDTYTESIMCPTSVSIGGSD